MKNNKILITGGSGYIGTVISNDLIKKKFKVMVIDNLSNSKNIFLDKKVRFNKIDLKNYKMVENFFKNNNLDTVIHLASTKSVSDSIRFKKKYFKEIYSNTVNLYLMAQKNKIKNFIYSSTAAVYGNCNKIVHENSLKKPLSPYGKYKLMAEQKLLNLNKGCKINLIILRYFNVAGADKNSGNQNINDNSLFSNIIKCHFKNKIFKIFGDKFNTPDGYAIRDFIHVKDLSYIHFLIIKKLNSIKRKKTGIFNLGYGKGISVNEILKSYKKIKNFNLKYKVMNYKFGDIEKSISSNYKIKKFLDIKFKYDSIDKMTKSHFFWIKKNLKKIFKKI